MKIYYSADWENYDAIDFPIGLLKSYYGFRNKKLYRPDICDSFFLDSGAFSAWTRQEILDIQKYMTYIKENMSQLDVYVALDDITSYEISLSNYEVMLKKDLFPLPTYHYGEPSWVLGEYLKITNYVALGGIAKLSKQLRLKWLDEIFIKYPDVTEVGFHGFGIQDIEILLRYPWKSVDASSWHVTARYGQIYSPFGRVAINRKVEYSKLNWITPESDEKIKKWVTDLGYDYLLAQENSMEGTIERYKINLAYFENLSNNKAIVIFEKRKKMKGLFDENK
jgi:hypothetical protein